MKTTSSASTKALLTIVAVFFFAMSFVYLEHVYVSLTAAFVIAYLLDPLVERLEERRMPREWGSFLVLIGFFVVVISISVVIFPKIFEQGRELLQRIPQMYSKLRDKIEPLSERYFGARIFGGADALLPAVGDASILVKPLGGIVGEVFSTGLKLVTAILGVLIIPLMAYYLMKDFPQYYKTLLSMIPRRHHKTVAELRERLNRVFGGFVRGQLGVSCILATYYSISLSVVGLRLSLVLGLLAGFLNVIPYLGIGSALVLTLLIALVHGAGGAMFLAIGIVYAVGIGVEGAVLTPRIVGRKVGLSPLTLILALVVGSELRGLVGMLLAVPFAAIAKVFLGYALDHYRGSESFNRS